MKPMHEMTESEKWAVTWDAFKLSYASKLRRMAANCVAKYVYEFHHHGNDCDLKACVAIVRRFRLGDYAETLFAVFPPKWQLSKTNHIWP